MFSTDEILQAYCSDELLSLVPVVQTFKFRPCLATSLSFFPHTSSCEISLNLKSRVNCYLSSWETNPQTIKEVNKCKTRLTQM